MTIRTVVCRQSPRGVLCLAVLLAVALVPVRPGVTADRPVASPEDPTAMISGSREFPRPPELAERIAFWTDIFTRYTTSQVVIHDAKHVGKIYGVLNLEGASDKEIGDASTAEKKRITALLLRLDRAGADPAALDARERAIFQMFRDVDEPRRFRAAADRVRSQRGLRERFAVGIEISRRYLPEIERIFREEGLPLELTRLPLIESTFDVTAYSKVGAAGVWQFMPQTGRIYGLRVDARVDERRDPIRAARAAARYLADAHAALGTWPLAITSYNHGVRGIARGVQTVGSSDIEVLIARYEGPAFGFAGRNFYPEFLAALDIDREPERYFGPLEYERPVPSEEVLVAASLGIGIAAEAVGIDRTTLADYNPALSGAVLRGSSYIPSGYRLRLPPGRRAGFERYVASRRARPEPTQVAHGGVHQVRQGQTLSHIASRYGTTVGELRRSNGIHNPNQVRIGQMIKVPSKGAQAVAANRRYIRHRVTRGQTLSQIAQRYGTSVGALKRHNGIRNEDRLQTGQVIEVPTS